MTRRELVLRILKEAGEDGVHSFEFYEAGMPRAAARIGELRDAGYTITSTHERYRGDAEGVRYRLIEAPKPALIPAVPMSEEVVNEAFDRLFPLPNNPHYRQDVA